MINYYHTYEQEWVWSGLVWSGLVWSGLLEFNMRLCWG